MGSLPAKRRFERRETADRQGADNRRMTSPIVIATRESRLALWQTEHVKARLQTRWACPPACWA